MSNYRCVFLPGGTFFFTVVTFERNPILTTELGISSLRQAFSEIQVIHPFKMETVVILPEHLHCIWELPEGDSDFSLRWKKIKAAFTKMYLAGGGKSGYVTPSRVNKGEKGIWQRRYWEHMVRDEFDLARHIDYIHFNPVKHDLVNCPFNWKWSSFSRYVKNGVFPKNWGANEPDSIRGMIETGE